jgi:hypothetical protein
LASGAGCGNDTAPANPSRCLFSLADWKSFDLDQLEPIIR